MSRAFTRALVISTISGLAVAPAIALAADTGSNAPASTVTTLSAPKSAHSGHSFMLSARVMPSAATPEHAAQDEESVLDSKKGGGKGKKGGTTVKKGKGKGKGAGKKPGKRHDAETGSVTFTIDGKTFKPVRLSHGRAEEKIELPEGKHTATASYSGDDNYRSSDSAPITFTVN
jgi:hypothetical protein